MTGSTPPPRRAGRRLGAVLAVAAAIALTVAGPARPAAAHSSLVSSDPAADSILTAPPTRVVLVFAQPVSSPDPKIAITVSGHRPIEIPAVVDGSTVVADLAGVAVPGSDSTTSPVGWTLGYRLVATDGDPFSGLLTFTVTTGSAGGDVASMDAPAPTSSVPGVGLPPGGDRSAAPGWIIAGVTVAAAAAAATLMMVRRRRHAGDQVDGSG